MIDFEINNSTRARLNRRLIQEAVSVFSSVSRIKKANFSLAFVGDTEMRRLNRDYRKKDKVTDVLSFTEEGDEFASISGEDDRRYLGEIIICLAQARRQAKEYGWSLNKEFARLLVHGLAHLIGYDHENVSVKKVKEMEAFEQKIMSKLGLAEK